MTKDFTATISEKSERAEMWQTVLGDKTIPIRSPIPTKANLPGKPAASIYEMDIESLTGEQREKLIDYLAERFGIPKAEVAHDLDEVGCPILAEDIIVTIQNPQKWF